MAYDVSVKEDAMEARYLTFRLGGTTYGIGILKVQEIIGLLPATPVPRMPAFVRGVINLRGRIIPVVDLRSLFDMEVSPDTERTCIVITQVGVGKGLVTMGVIVEDVAEVVDIPRDLIEEVPEFGSDIRTEFLLGMGKVPDKVVMLLDIDCVLSGEDVSIVEGLAKDA